MALETALAEAQATREASANDHNADNLWTRGDFARRAPGMDWSAFFAAAGLARQEAFVAWQPTAVTGLGRVGRGRNRWRRGRTTCAFMSSTVLPMCCRVPSPSGPLAMRAAA